MTPDDGTVRVLGGLSLAALAAAAMMAAIATRAALASHWDTASAAITAAAAFGWSGQVFARAWARRGSSQARDDA
jgi:hypothetical protein